MQHIKLDRSNSHHPYYLQILEQIRHCIFLGELTVGTLLTPSRQLALQLNISRQTVVNAYEELCAQGYCISKVGHGTIVADIGKVEAIEQSCETAKLPSWLSLERSIDKISPEISPVIEQSLISFEPGLAQTDYLPFKTMTRAFREVMHAASTSFSEYKRRNGHPNLLEAICREVLPQRGIQASPDRVFITNGSLHSSFLLAELLSTYANSISYGVPGYLAIPQNFIDREITGLSCPIDSEGVCLTSDAKKASLHYVMPEHHFPQGVTLSPERRAKLLQLAEQNDALIIEDDYDSEFYFDRHPLPALKAIDRTEKVIYMGTFSKVLFNGLRVGYIVAHPTIIQELTNLRWRIEGGTSLVLQLWLAELINSGIVERHLRRMRVQHRQKRNLIADYLRRDFPDWQWSLPHGGLQFWIQLPYQQNAEVIIQQFRKQKIQLFSGFEYCDRNFKESKSYITLGFGGVTKTQIHQAFERLK